MTNRRRYLRAMRNPDSGGGFWHPSAWYLAAVVHLFVGVCVILAGHSRGWDMGWLMAVFVVATGVKEFALDLSPLEGDTLWGSTQDFLCYQAGAGVGWLALLYFWAAVAAAVVIVVFFVVVDIWKERNGGDE